MALSALDRQYRGRRRLSGNYGRIYINGVEIFEINSFEVKVTAERDDVYIGNSKDSKVTGLAGEFTVNVKKVFTRGINRLIQNLNDGYDERFTLILEVSDPDSVGQMRERVKVENAWFNELPVINAEKGSVVEGEYSGGFTPSDLSYESVIDKADTGISIERH